MAKITIKVIDRISNKDYQGNNNKVIKQLMKDNIYNLTFTAIKFQNYHGMYGVMCAYIDEGDKFKTFVKLRKNKE